MEETKNGDGKQANAKDAHTKGGRGFYRPKEEKRKEQQNDDAQMSESGVKASPKNENTPPTHQQRGRRQENLEEGAKHKNFHRRRENDQEREMLEENTMISFNIRCFNREERQRAIGQIILENEIHLVCLNETKL